ncbi:MAG TPA: M81 family metallopeptidase [Geminicoccaceae bacterium]|nr:M81 family metallopeptidase [Geminicoccaceae bacterium]
MTRVFTAALATEINTYSPLPVDLESFREGLLVRPGEHPEWPSVVTGPVVAARRHAKAAGWTLIEGTCASAAPGGPVNRRTYEALRDEILQQLQDALPLDAAIFGLHGAMVAHGYDDCEGDLLQRARQIVGPDVLIAAEFDPHCHFTREMAQALNIAVFYKEFPHVDFYERAEELIGLVDRALKGEIAPRLATYDCRMIDVLPTSREPMKSFVEKIRRIEREDRRVLSISVVHGFRAADVPEMGSKVVVVADGDHAHGHALAKQLAHELFANHGRSMPPLLTPEEAIAAARACPRRPVVLADIWGNPGGGVPGDNTVLLRAMLRAGVENAAFATIWDPMAVRICRAAGEGARLKLRFGGKSCAGIGDPIDADVVVQTVQENATQTFVDAVVSLGPSAVIQVGGIEVILNTYRTQPFEPTIFTNLGIPATERDVLVVKSTNHFYKGFAAISSDILYVECPGVYPSDYRKTPYHKVRRPLRPLDDITWADVERNQTFA